MHVWYLEEYKSIYARIRIKYMSGKYTLSGVSLNLDFFIDWQHIIVDSYALSDIS